jgi:catechol 2,3-dioxygenase
MQPQIHPETSIGVVSLKVQLLTRSIDYYVNVLGFQVHENSDDRAVLGAGKDELLILDEVESAVHYPGTTGLYHVAILLPSRLQLALNLRQLTESQIPVQGFADHWVSEAVYLSDPDGNGIEIYRDRPPDEWPRLDGQLQMGTDSLDIAGVMEELSNATVSWSGLPDSTKIGHVHLQVADIPAADAFYSGLLGFDLIMHYANSAGFVSAGGYHHHIGYNTWSSLGAKKPPANASGLDYYSIKLPDEPALGAILDRIRHAGWPFEEIDDGVYLNDPSGNGILLRAN